MILFNFSTSKSIYKFYVCLGPKFRSRSFTLLCFYLNIVYLFTLLLCEILVYCALLLMGWKQTNLTKPEILFYLDLVPISQLMVLEENLLSKSPSLVKIRYLKAVCNCAQLYVDNCKLWHQAIAPLLSEDLIYGQTLNNLVNKLVFFFVLDLREYEISIDPYQTCITSFWSLFNLI